MQFSIENNAASVGFQVVYCRVYYRLHITYEKLNDLGSQFIGPLRKYKRSTNVSLNKMNMARAEWHVAL